MPFGRYPGRVKGFKKWAAGQIDNSALSDSATPHGALAARRYRRKRRRRKSSKGKRRKQNALQAS